MFEEYLDQIDINMELDRFYALEKRADDVIDNYNNGNIGADEYVYSLEEMSDELDDIGQSFKDLLDGNKKREMLGKIKGLKNKLSKLITKFYNLGA